MPARHNLGRRRSRSIAAAITLCGGLLGCATVDQKFGNDGWYQKTKAGTTVAADATVKAAGVAADTTRTVAGEAYKRMQKYAAEKDLLKTFTDASEHSELVVLDILHKPPPKTAGRPGAAGTTPGTTQGPGGTKGGGRTNPAPGASASPRASASSGGPAGSATPGDYSGSLRWPVDACIISSKFGARWGKVHKGLDLAADVGEPVYAIAPGTVIYAGDGLRGYGNVVILRHDKSLTSLYAHNSELKVKQGDVVTQGQLISLLGSTGHSTGPHVHFEIREGDTAVDPMLKLPKSKFADVIGPMPDTRVATATTR